MRTVISGAGLDTTAAVKAYLLTGKNFWLPNLYLIGEPESPNALWLTDYEAPLSWPVWTSLKVAGARGVAHAFDPAVIGRGTVTTRIGLDVQTLELRWTPKPSPYTSNLATANPYQLMQLGFYDNYPVRLWRGFMPTPGDLNTYGACDYFGGRVSDGQVSRGELVFKVNSFLDVVNQLVPPNIIENTNTLAGFYGAVPPANHSAIPQMVIPGVGTQAPNLLIAAETSPSSGNIFDRNSLRDGFLVFNPGSSLAGVWSAIYANERIHVSGTDYNEIQLYSALPFPPVPGDTFYVSGALPITRTAWQQGTFYPFGAIVIGSGYAQVVTTEGDSGGTEPTWNTTPGGTTADGSTLVWTNRGLASAILSSIDSSFPFVPAPTSAL